MLSIGVQVPVFDSKLKRCLILCKMISLICCIVGTVVYVQPSNYGKLQYLRIFLPAFLTGYVLLAISEILAIMIRTEHVFMEMCFGVIGAAANAFSGFIELTNWYNWPDSTNELNDAKVFHEYKVRRLVQSLACIFHATALSLGVLLRVLERHPWRTSD